MIGKKTLREVKAEVAALLKRLPGGNPKDWLDREIKSARGNADRDVETLEMLRAALEKESLKRTRPNKRGTVTKR